MRIDHLPGTKFHLLNFSETPIAQQSSNLPPINSLIRSELHGQTTPQNPASKSYCIGSKSSTQGDSYVGKHREEKGNSKSPERYSALAEMEGA